MKTVKIFSLIILSIFTIINSMNANYQDALDSYKIKIERNEKQATELLNYIMKYGIVKDIKYFEKLLEKHKYIEKKEQALKEGLKYFKKCINEKEICKFLGKKSNEQKGTSEVEKSIENAEDSRKENEIQVEKLTKIVDDLHKYKKEIEEREKNTPKDAKFQAEKSPYVKKHQEINKEETNIEKTIKTMEKDIEETNKMLYEKEKIGKKLDNLLKNYNFKEKYKIYKDLLEKFIELKKKIKNPKMDLIIEIIKEKIEWLFN